ncbi:hypothetical protein [Vulcanisaeta sp. JCM 16161]|nr:hypothetical protein [Vulcanisaeta sp. JCM 16161]
MSQGRGDVIRELEAVFKDRLFTEPHVLAYTAMMRPRRLVLSRWLLFSL